MCFDCFVFFPPPGIHDYKLRLAVHVHILPSEQRSSTKQHILTFKRGPTGESTIHLAAFSIVLHKLCDKTDAKTFLEAAACLKLTVGRHAVALRVVGVRCVWPRGLQGGAVLGLSVCSHDARQVS